MENEQVLLTEKDVWNVLQFANSLNGTYGMGVYTPQMLNSTLINLNNNPQAADEQKVMKALVNYKSSASDLQSMNEFMEYTDMLFKRTINYYAGLLSFDLSMSCINAYTIDDYKSKEYEEDKRRIYKFLDRFKYRAEFYKMTKEVLRHETVFTWFRDDDKTSTLQTMPQKYCILTGYFPQGLLYNFDMSYFLQAGVDIDNYDSVFKDYYNKVFDNPNTEVYRQSKNFNNMDSTFALWTETSPNEGAWAFKLDNTNFNNVPFLSALMKDTVFNDTIRRLQKDKRMLEAQKLIIGELPLFDSTKIVKADQFAIDPNTAGALLAIIRSSVSDNFKFGAMPCKDVEEYQYEDKNADAYSKQLNTTAGVGASASRVVYSDDRMSQEEIRQSLMADYEIVKPLYAQFANFLEFFANKKTKKYKFRFTFDGSTLGFEKKERQDSIFKLAENGLLLPSAIQSAFGFTPMDFDAQLMEGRAMGFKLESIHTASDKNSGGRPTAESKNENLGENGEKSVNAK